HLIRREVPRADDARERLDAHSAAAALDAAERPPIQRNAARQVGLRRPSAFMWACDTVGPRWTPAA
ncbi:MAG TPA: hypothetical protein PKZ82_12085, partial [Microthrixaceae bacterium]|nr:hypothetical protein [Microthrixaceae bacterium]